MKIFLFVASVLVVVGDAGVLEVLVVVVPRHPENTIVGILPAKLLFQLVGPVGVIVSPRTRVVFIVPRVAQLSKQKILTIVLHILDIEKTVSVT